MDFKPATVALDLIDTAVDTYRITTNRAVDDLTGSLGALGLINPPILREAHNGYTIVSGFRRVAACRRLGWSKIAARIAAPEPDDRILARLAISDNSCQRPLNLMERAHAVALLARDAAQPRELAQAAAELGIADGVDMVAKLRDLSRLPREIQSAVADQILPLPVALEIGKYPHPAAIRLTGLFCELKPSLNRQREIIGLLKEIARREETALAEVIGETGAAAILGDPEGDHNQKTRRLLEWLRRRRFPQICRTQEAFTHLLKKVRLGPGGSLQPPKHFEATTFTLQLPFRDLAELERHRDALSALLEDRALIGFLADRFEVSA
jgi:ParB family chromosome partitioning protein